MTCNTLCKQLFWIKLAHHVVEYRTFFTRLNEFEVGIVIQQILPDSWLHINSNSPLLPQPPVVRRNIGMKFCSCVYTSSYFFL